MYQILHTTKGFLKLIYLFLALSYCVQAFSSCSVQASHCGGFSRCGAQA